MLYDSLVKGYQWAMLLGSIALVSAGVWVGFYGPRNAWAWAGFPLILFGAAMFMALHNERNINP